MDTFSIGESLRFAWDKIKTNSRVVFPAVLVMAVLQILIRFAAPDHGGAMSGIIGLVGGITSFVITVGFTIIVLKLSRGQSAALKEIIPPLRLLWQYFLVCLVVGLMVLAVVVATALVCGIAFLILRSMDMWSLIPAILVLGPIVLAGVAVVFWIALTYFFIRFAAIDGVYPVKEILARSTGLSKGIRLRLILFIIVIALISIAGAITVVGLLLSIPIVEFAIAHVYLHRSGQLSVVPATPESTPASSSQPIE
jgi:hypothetical protein